MSPDGEAERSSAPCPGTVGVVPLVLSTFTVVPLVTVFAFWIACDFGRIITIAPAMMITTAAAIAEMIATLFFFGATWRSSTVGAASPPHFDSLPVGAAWRGPRLATAVCAD